MDTARERAKELARHYFRLLAQAAGMKWDADYDGEINTLIDLIIEAAQESGGDHFGAGIIYDALPKSAEGAEG